MIRKLSTETSSLKKQFAKSTKIAIAPPFKWFSPENKKFTQEKCSFLSSIPFYSEIIFLSSQITCEGIILHLTFSCTGQLSFYWTKLYWATRTSDVNRGETAYMKGKNWVENVNSDISLHIKYTWLCCKYRRELCCDFITLSLSNNNVNVFYLKHLIGFVMKKHIFRLNYFWKMDWQRTDLIN